MVGQVAPKGLIGMLESEGIGKSAELVVRCRNDGVSKRDGSFFRRDGQCFAQCGNVLSRAIETIGA